MAGEPTPIVAESPAPEAAVEAGAVERPSPPQPAPVEPGKAPSTVDVRALQAGYTQRSMEVAAVKDALGLPKAADRSQILDAIAQLRRPPSAMVTDDPELAVKYAEIDEKQWRLVGKEFGEDVMAHVRHLRDVALTTGDAEEMAIAFYAAHEALGRQAEASPEPAGAAPAPGGVEEFEMESPLGGLGQNQSPPDLAELRHSGNLREAARRLFARGA